MKALFITTINRSFKVTRCWYKMCIFPLNWLHYKCYFILIYPCLSNPCLRSAKLFACLSGWPWFGIQRLMALENFTERSHPCTMIDHKYGWLESKMLRLTCKLAENEMQGVVRQGFTSWWRSPCRVTKQNAGFGCHSPGRLQTLPRPVMQH